MAQWIWKHNLDRSCVERPDTQRMLDATASYVTSDTARAGSVSKGSRQNSRIGHIREQLKHVMDATEGAISCVLSHIESGHFDAKLCAPIPQD